MSLLTNDHRISVKPFAAVPNLLGLPEIQRRPEAQSPTISSYRWPPLRGNVNLEEGCLIAKSTKYTHQLAHMVNAVRSGNPRPIVSQNFQGDSDNKIPPGTKALLTGMYRSISLS